MSIDYFIPDVESIISRCRDLWVSTDDYLPMQEDYNDYLLLSDQGDFAIGNYRHDAKAWDSSNFGWLEVRGKDHILGITKVKYWLPIPINEKLMPYWKG